MKYKLTSILIGLILAGSLYSQDKREEMLDGAIDIFGFNKKGEAFEEMNKVIAKYPDFDRAYFVKANWHITYNEYPQALEALEKLNQLNPSFNPLQKKMLAETYFQVRQYDRARQWAKDFLETPSLNPQNKSDAESLIRNIDFAESNPLDNFNIQFHLLGPEVNTNESEYFPSTNADESALYFTRKTLGSEDIWVSQSRNGAWTSSIPIDEPEIEGVDKVVSINSYENDGAHTIAPTGRFLFFTSCNRPRSYGSCDLFFAKRTGNQWGKPSILSPPINSGAWETQPCISADGKYLYYVSSRNGGYGKGDIYVTKIQEDGKFSAPENLGAEINTSGSEDKPFIHPDGMTLYFSSDGHPGYGQRDLFMSRKIDGKWSKPINLGSQINSNNDESAIFINALGNRAYVSKQNPDKVARDYDIYTFDLPEKYQPKKVTYIKGVVTNAKTNQPIKASVKIQNIDKNESVMSISSDDKNGDFLLTLVADENYGFNIVKEGYAIYSNNYSFKTSSDDKPQTLEIKLQPLEAGTRFELQNVFFETGKYDLKPESNNELNYIVDILTKNPTIKIQISGHTDNVGNAQANQTLSENRSKSVLEYFVSKGIAVDRLRSNGYGASKPISSNDTEEGRAKNRRTEIEIL